MKDRAMFPTVIVIGGGAIGLSAAAAIARRGRRNVMVFERIVVGSDLASSQASTRIFRLAHERREDLDDAADRWAALERLVSMRLLQQIGGLDFGAGLETMATNLSEAGHDVRLLADREVRQRFSTLAARCGPALFQPDAAVIRAADTLWALRRILARHGATVTEGQRVLRVTDEGTRATVNILTATRRSGPIQWS